MLSGDEVRRILEKNGFTLVRRRGSHASMQKAVPGSTVTVPVPLHDELKSGALLSIIRQSGLPRSLFESYQSVGQDLGPATRPICSR